jgi:hypothetical protein
MVVEVLVVAVSLLLLMAERLEPVVVLVLVLEQML